MSDDQRSAEQVGRCGAAAQVFITGGSHEVCALPHGHSGWHRADSGMEWTQTAENDLLMYAGKAVHAARWHDDGECDDPSGCGATVEDERAARAVLAIARAAVESLAVDINAGDPWSEAYREARDELTIPPASEVRDV